MYNIIEVTDFLIWYRTMSSFETPSGLGVYPLTCNKYFNWKLKCAQLGRSIDLILLTCSKPHAFTLMILYSSLQPTSMRIRRQVHTHTCMYLMLVIYTKIIAHSIVYNHTAHGHAAAQCNLCMYSDYIATWWFKNMAFVSMQAFKLLCWCNNVEAGKPGDEAVVH